MEISQLSLRTLGERVVESPDSIIQPELSLSETREQVDNARSLINDDESSNTFSINHKNTIDVNSLNEMFQNEPDLGTYGLIRGLLINQFGSSYISDSLEIDSRTEQDGSVVETFTGPDGKDYRLQYNSDNELDNDYQALLINETDNEIIEFSFDESGASISREFTDNYGHRRLVESKSDSTTHSIQNETGEFQTLTEAPEFFEINPSFVNEWAEENGGVSSAELGQFLMADLFEANPENGVNLVPSNVENVVNEGTGEAFRVETYTGPDGSEYQLRILDDPDARFQKAILVNKENGAQAKLVFDTQDSQGLGAKYGTSFKNSDGVRHNSWASDRDIKYKTKYFNEDLRIIETVSDKENREKYGNNYIPFLDPVLTRTEVSGDDHSFKEDITERRSEDVDLVRNLNQYLENESINNPETQNYLKEAFAEHLNLNDDDFENINIELNQNDDSLVFEFQGEMSNYSLRIEEGSLSYAEVSTFSSADGNKYVNHTNVTEHDIFTGVMKFDSDGNLLSDEYYSNSEDKFYAAVVDDDGSIRYEDVTDEKRSQKPLIVIFDDYNGEFGEPPDINNNGNIDDWESDLDHSDIHEAALLDGDSENQYRIVRMHGSIEENADALKVLIAENFGNPTVISSSIGIPVYRYTEDDLAQINPEINYSNFRDHEDEIRDFYADDPLHNNRFEFYESLSDMLNGSGRLIASMGNSNNIDLASLTGLEAVASTDLESNVSHFNQDSFIGADLIDSGHVLISATFDENNNINGLDLNSDGTADIDLSGDEMAGSFIGMDAEDLPIMSTDDMQTLGIFLKLFTGREDLSDDELQNIEDFNSRHGLNPDDANTNYPNQIKNYFDDFLIPGFGRNHGRFEQIDATTGQITALYTTDHDNRIAMYQFGTSFAKPDIDDLLNGAIA